jgi:hypothetical protein
MGVFVKTTILSLFIICSFTNFNAAHANGLKKIAILPFELHSKKDITNIKYGIGSMLASRLSWADHTLITDQTIVINALKQNIKLPKEKFLSAMAKATGSDFILTGSITEFSNAFSIDAMVYNTKDNTSQPFFAQVSKIEKIIPEVNLLAAKINKEIFNRTTAQYEEFTEEQSYAKQRQKQQRMDPEKMITPRYGADRGEDRPWWQVWQYF